MSQCPCCKTCPPCGVRLLDDFPLCLECGRDERWSRLYLEYATACDACGNPLEDGPEDPDGLRLRRDARDRNQISGDGLAFVKRSLSADLRIMVFCRFCGLPLTQPCPGCRTPLKSTRRRTHCTTCARPLATCSICQRYVVQNLVARDRPICQDCMEV